MQKYSKKGFTVAEALICFIIIGSVLLSGICSFSQKEDYNALYWQAFDTLYQASKNIQEEWKAKVNQDICKCNVDDCMHDETCYKPECWRDSKAKQCTKQERDSSGGTPTLDRDFPGFLYNQSTIHALAGYGQDEEFCKKFVEKINTFPGQTCKSFISTLNYNKIKQGIGFKFQEAFSSDTEGGNGTQSGILPSFVAANGQQFYFSVPVSANFSAKSNSDWNSYQHLARESYRFVVVDLNGNSPPNTQFEINGRRPDIVLFAINSSGDVIPLGLPEFSKDYINAVVYYPTDLKEDGSPVYSKVKSAPMTLWMAKKYAWGMSEENENSTNKPPYRSPVSYIEPLSQSSKMYATAIGCRDKIMSGTEKCGYNGENNSEDQQYADDLFTSLILQFAYKEEGKSDFYSNFSKDENTHVSTANGCVFVEKESDIPTCTIEFQHEE